MFSVNVRAKSSCDILKSVGISREIWIFSAQYGLILLRGIHIKHHPAATDLCCEIRWAINGIDLTGSGTAFCHLTGDGEGRSGIDAAAAVCGIQPTEV